MNTKIAAATVAAVGVLGLGVGTALSNNAHSSGNASMQSGGAMSHRGQSGMGQGQQGHGQGMGMGKGQGQGQGMVGATTGTAGTLTLTSKAKDELLYMREEETLAQDVYATLAQRYPDAPFSRITRSEAQHASAIQRQLDRAGIPDPTTGNAVGEFENADLQKLYDALIVRGSTSLTSALNVGALIEETDIADLRDSAKTTKDATLLRVYSNLERASDQHLRIFTGQLKAVGVTYAPTVLSKTDVDTILSQSMHR